MKRTFSSSVRCDPRAGPPTVHRMDQPTAVRPHMPGYGIAGSDGGSGLLPWSWAVEQLVGSRNYWVSSVGVEGQPHAMPVWGVWLDDALWFSTGGRSRKARNLRHEPRCAVATQDPEQPVVLQGTAEIVRERDLLVTFLDAANAKYDSGMDLDFLDPDVNLTVRVPPIVVIGLREADFTGSPTRWTFG